MNFSVADTVLEPKGNIGKVIKVLDTTIFCYENEVALPYPGLVLGFYFGNELKKVG